LINLLLSDALADPATDATANEPNRPRVWSVLTGSRRKGRGVDDRLPGSFEE